MRGLVLVVLAGVIAGCGVTGAASLPKSTACVTVLSNVTSIENQAEADLASGSAAKAAHDYTVGAQEIRHDVALLNPSDPAVLAARQIATQAAKAGKRLAAEARRTSSISGRSLPALKTAALTAACP